MIIEVKNQDVYIPHYKGNDKLPADQQIKVNHRFLLPGERDTYIYTEDPIVDKATGKVNFKVKAVQNMKGITQAIITSIENLEIKADGKIVKVDTVDKLYNTSGIPDGLIKDIEVHMFLASPEVDVDFL